MMRALLFKSTLRTGLGGMVLLGLGAACTPQPLEDPAGSRDHVVHDLQPLPRPAAPVTPPEPEPPPPEPEPAPPPEPPPVEEPAPEPEWMNVDVEEEPETETSRPPGEIVEDEPAQADPVESIEDPPPAMPLPDHVASAQTRFTQTLTRLEQDRQTALNQLNAAYARELESLERSQQAAGSLEGVMAVKRERERFDHQREVSAGDLDDSLAELNRLQSLYRTSRHDGALLENARATLQLMDRYTEGLDRLVRELVQAGDIEHAQAVRHEINRVDRLPSRDEAKRVVATASRAQGNIAAEPGTAAPVAWGNGVYRRGEEPAFAGSELIVRHTQHSRAVAHRGRLQLLVREESHLTEDTRSRHSRYTHGEMAHFPRLILRLPPRDALDGGTAVFQYFANPLGESARFVLMRTEHIPLPHLTQGQEVIIDGAGARYPLSEYRYFPRSGHDRASGHRHSGIIASVYDRNGELVAQGTDALSLADQASSTLPEPLNDVRGEIYRHGW